MRHGARRKYAQGARRKKLTQAGRAWATPAQTDDDDAAYFGFVIDQPETFYLDHANSEAWEVFQGCCEQWVFKPMGEPLCIDRSAIQSVLGIFEIKNTRETFEKVRFIEQGALAQMAEQAALEKLKTP